MFDVHEVFVSTAALTAIPYQDHHAIFHTPSGDHGYPEYLERVRELLEDGSKAEILELKMHEKGVEYRVQLITSDGETVGVHSVATVDHGKIVEVNQESE